MYIYEYIYIYIYICTYTYVYRCGMSHWTAGSKTWKCIVFSTHTFIFKLIMFAFFRIYIYSRWCTGRCVMSQCIAATNTWKCIFVFTHILAFIFNIFIFVFMYTRVEAQGAVWYHRVGVRQMRMGRASYGVAPIGRLLQIICLFCRIQSLL